MARKRIAIPGMEDPDVVDLTPVRDETTLLYWIQAQEADLERLKRTPLAKVQRQLRDGVGDLSNHTIKGELDGRVAVRWTWVKGGLKWDTSRMAKNPKLVEEYAERKEGYRRFTLL